HGLPMLKLIRAVGFGFVLALGPVATGCISQTRHTVEEVREALAKAPIVGSSPQQVISLLGRVRLAHGDSIDVGSYYPKSHRIFASVSPARRSWFTRWAIDVTVTFDSVDKAKNVDVEYSAISPM
ncbi:MAG: hypothetical protein ACREN3_05355, partial [Gemmatimonadaceae bacterium]